MNHLSSWCCLVLFVLRQEPLPPGAMARINGELVSRAEYGDWLAQAHGWQFVDEFLTLKALRQEAAKHDIHVTEHDLAVAADQDWQDNVRMRFGGREEKFLAELRAGGIDREGYRLRRQPALEVELLANRLLMATRPDDERVLKQLHEIEFGKEAMRTHLRVAFFDKFKDLDPAQTQPPNLLRDLETKARERAQVLVTRLHAPDTSFAQLVAELSDPNYTPRIDGWVADLKEAGGDLPRYTKAMFGGALEECLRAAPKPGDVLGPIVTATGAYVVQFLSSEPAPFARSVDELKAINRTRRATPREIHEYKTQLLQAAKIERAGK